MWLHFSSIFRYLHQMLMCNITVRNIYGRWSQDIDSPHYSRGQPRKKVKLWHLLTYWRLHERYRGHCRFQCNITLYYTAWVYKVIFLWLVAVCMVLTLGGVTRWNVNIFFKSRQNRGILWPTFLCHDIFWEKDAFQVLRLCQGGCSS